jgi:uncharacterized protein YegL
LPEGSLKCSALLIPDAGGKAIYQDSGDATLMVTLIPPQPKPGVRLPKDVVFVLDRSGSMDGWKIAAARRAMARMVDTLSPNDRFGVIAFDTSLLTLGMDHEGLLPATDRNRFRAAEFLAKVEADGGTEMLPPIQMALKTLAKRKAGREQILFLVTDGEVGNEGPLIQKVQHGHTHCRVQILGIGESANDSLLQRMAATSKGWFLAAEGPHVLDRTLLEAARRFGQPVVADLRIKGTGLLDESTVSSGSMDIYPGTPLIVLTRVKGPGKGMVVNLEGVEAGPGKFACRLTTGQAETIGVRSVWARWKIRDLEDSGDRSGEVLSTSLAHGVLSKYTAFLAVDERGVVNPGGNRATLVQPVEDEDTESDTCSMVRHVSPSRVYGGHDNTAQMIGSPAPCSFGCPRSNDDEAASILFELQIDRPVVSKLFLRSVTKVSLEGVTYEEALEHARVLAELAANSPIPVTKRWLKDLAKEMTRLKPWLLAHCNLHEVVIMAFLEFAEGILKPGQPIPASEHDRIALQAKTACAELHEWLSENSVSTAPTGTSRRFWET